MGIRRSFWYLVSNGILWFLVGRVLPKKWFSPSAAPFRPFAFEKDGAFYDRFGIRFWHKKLPDMSRYLPRLMPKKALEKGFSSGLLRMLQETCVAEFTHLALMITSLKILEWTPLPLGIALLLIYNLLFNLPFVMIQRYNRPRLSHLSERIDERRSPVVEGTLAKHA